MQFSRSIRTAGAFEYLMWIFTRFSGLGLMIFGAVSMGMAFIMGGRRYLDMPAFFRWMFFPNPNHVVNTDIPDVTVGWSNAFWQIFSFLVLFMAAGHGFNGLRMILEDYLESPLLIVLLRALILTLWLGGMIVAVFVVLAS
jgi:succinate dehydrogenase / fumarate reductase membrane anchor subunit